MKGKASVMGAKQVRIIARLDIKNNTLVKPVQMEGLKVIGDPSTRASYYYKSGIDEIIYIDIVASLYERNNILGIIESTTSNIFIPITVGGGIRSIDNANQAFHSGADKISINTAAIKDPLLLRQLATQFGSQSITLSIEAKREDNDWQAYYDNGREPSGKSVVEWAQQAVALGVGEILLTSVDREGTTEGFDCELIQSVASKVSVPVIASGGAGELSHLYDAIKSGADAIALAHLFHYEKTTISAVKNYLASKGIWVRHSRHTT